MSKYRILKNKYGYYKIQVKRFWFWVDETDFYKSGDGTIKPMKLTFNVIEKCYEYIAKARKDDCKKRLKNQPFHKSFKVIRSE